MRSVLLLAGGLAACARTPTAAITWRESWEILALTEDLGLLDLRGTVANTGLLRGQGTMRLDRCFSATSALAAGRDEAPANVAISPAHDAVQIGPDSLRLESGGVWTGSISGPDGAARLQIRPSGEGLPPTSWMEGGGQWAISAPVTEGDMAGWAEAGERGGLLRGRAVVLHRGGDGVPRGGRLSAVVLGRGISAGLDAEGEGQQRWLRVDGATLDASAGAFSWQPKGRAILDFRPAAEVWISLRHPIAACSRDPLEHLFPVEQFFARLAGFGDVLGWQRYEAEIHVADQVMRASAVVLSSGERADGAPTKPTSKKP